MYMVIVKTMYGRCLSSLGHPSGLGQIPSRRINPEGQFPQDIPQPFKTLFTTLWLKGWNSSVHDDGDDDDILWISLSVFMVNVKLLDICASTARELRVEFTLHYMNGYLKWPR